MFISELRPGTDVCITIHIGVEKLEFLSEVVKITDKEGKKALNYIKKTTKAEVIPIRPIEKDGKAISFNIKGVIFKALGTHNDRPYIWVLQCIRLIELSNKDRVHVLVCKDDVDSFNRRNGYRLWLGSNSIIQIGTYRKTDDAIVKDLSMNGIGLIVKLDVKGEVGNIVHVVFEDEKTNTKFRLEAIIVRIIEIDEYKKLFGCKLNKESAGIARYINIKQMERLALGGRKELLKKAKDKDLTIAPSDILKK